MEGVPVVCNFGCCHQFPTVFVEVIHDKNASNFIGSSNFSGWIVFLYFLQHYELTYGKYSLVVLMDELFQKISFPFVIN